MEPYGPWRPLVPRDVGQLFGAFNGPWWIAGGWAIDLFVGRQTRPHGDTDVLVLRRDQLAVQRVLDGWDLHAADPPGTLRPWGAGECLRSGIHDIWCRPTPETPWALQVMCALRLLRAMPRAKRRTRGPTSRNAVVPMVYDGYHGGFVPVEVASFDVSLTPETVVQLPFDVLEDQRAAAESEERRRRAADTRRARPRCGGRRHRVQTVTRAADGLLALCAACAEGLDVAATTSPALIDALSARQADPRAQTRRRRELERRLQAHRHERDLAAGGIGSCPLCGQFRRLIVSDGGAVRGCRACVGGDA